jgi:chitinase
MLLSLIIPVLGLFTEVQAVSSEFFSVATRCPFECGLDRSDWAPFHDTSELNICNKTLLLDVNLYYKIDGQESLFAMRGCAIGGPPLPKLAKRQTLVAPNTPSSHNISTSLFDIRNQTADLQILRFENNVGKSLFLADGPSISASTAALADALKSTKNGATTTLFAKTGNAIIGVYIGSQIDSASASSVIREFAIRVGSSKAPQIAAQLCGPDLLGTQIFGIYLHAGGDLGATRDAVRKWRDADCLVPAQTSNVAEVWRNAPLVTIPGSDIVVGPDTSGNGHLDKRATCSYTQAQAGDGCWQLADRCKITQDQLKQYNSDKGDVCGAVKEGQYFCCSTGSLPDFSPQPNSDGTCKTTSIDTDFCGVIAEKNQMTVAQIEERNKNTWGWAGCGFLLPGQVLCISTGSPPMPASLPNAVCGPQVPNTPKPSNTNDLASLNACPLRACCNVWGQCGTTKDFCIKSPADTGSPGTTKPGANSCTYNCGMDVVNNGSPPSSFIKLGYFEAFNQQRPCLKMRPGQISGYTHIHYAFGGISTSFNVDMTGQTDMFDEFKALTGVKRIMSFGGWSFSTEQDTFPIFREGVTAAQRDTFAKNVVKFVTDNGLDGVDFDWEYPAAPDIPGIPPGSKEDGQNYLAFLKLVRSYMPRGKTIAVAAPASFWYLKGFPIEDMSKVLDYIVYMTYDIHGQWDYGNGWTS